MIILGIDPGYDRLGVAVLKKEQGKKEELLFSECIVTDKKALFHERLFSAGQQLEEIIRKWKPTNLALEKLFFSKNQKTAMAVSEVRGMIIYIGSVHNLSLSEFTPQQVKIAITGYGGAGKANLADMIPKLISLPLKKRLDDEYDAIGITLTAAATARFH
jgi:crossover junction endodeoxyribonuclease RuvC